MMEAKRGEQGTLIWDLRFTFMNYEPDALARRAGEVVNLKS